MDTKKYSQKIVKIDNLEILILRKHIKNLYLKILPPDGEVRLSAPFGIDDHIIKMFIVKKLPWIKKHIKNFQNQLRQPKKKFVSGENFYFKGQKYILKVKEAKKPKIEIINKEHIYFYVPKHYTSKKKENYYNKWLRRELKEELKTLVPKWEKLMKVKVNEVRIKKMKTKWGTCNIKEKRIWINLETIKKPIECLEYIVVHEMVHFFERKHNKRFKAYLNHFLPEWKSYDALLKQSVLEDI